MEQQSTLLVLTSLQESIPYCSASKESIYLQKNSLLDVFLFQLKIFGFLQKEIYLYNTLLCILRNHCVWTLYFIPSRRMTSCK